MNEQSEQINELAAALAKAQGAMRPAAKDSTNPHFRSRYADLTSVWEACRGPLTDNGLSVVQMPVNHQEGYAALRTMLLHSSGQWMATTISARLVKDDAQGVGSALTYLRRYSLAAMVGVVADEDDDGNAASRLQPQREAPRREPDRPAPPSEREKLVNALRAAYREAKAAGADVTPPDKATVDGWTDGEIRDALTIMRAATMESRTPKAAYVRI